MHCSIKNTRSFINKLKRRGPSIEPCSTPAITPLSELNLLTYFHPHRGRTSPHSYACSAASFSRKPILCETSNIFYSQKYQVWQKDNKKFLVHQKRTWGHVGQLSKFCPRQQLFTFKEFRMKTRLHNISKTTNATNFTKTIPQSS